MIKRIVGVLCLLGCAVPVLGADPDDLDDYKVRITGLWWHFDPSGYIGTNAGQFDLKRDFGFDRSDSFSGQFDWRFARKHHILFTGTPSSISRTTTLARTITYEGVTYPAGVNTTAHIDWTTLAPGYQYDIVRRNQGFLAIGTQVFFLNPQATLTATVTVGGQTVTRTSTASHFVALPVLGPRFRFYPIPKAGWLALDGYIQGMYFGQYGDFWTGRGSVNVGIKHVKFVAGYQWGTRLRLSDNTSGPNDFRARLSEQGPVIGAEFTF